MDEPLVRKCYTCFFCVVSKAKENSGLCYFNPPTPVNVGDEFHAVRVAVDLYNDWCGRHMTHEEYHTVEYRSITG